MQQNIVKPIAVPILSLFILTQSLIAAEPVPAPEPVLPETSVTEQAPGAETQTTEPQTETVFLMQTSALSESSADPRVLGLENGTTVSGTVEIRPNLDQLPGVQKVAYYLNGSKSGKVYQDPFMWGGVNGDGTTGFDTTTIPDGTYDLALVYTDGTGDHGIRIDLTVDNSGTPPPPPPPGEDPDGDPDPTTDAAFLGVEQNGTVSGTVEIRPNPGELPGVQKVAYYLNGTKSGKVYQAPFIWGGVNGDGTSGFNTTTIPDGAYTLSMAYTDGSGDHAVEINFTVNNGGTPPPPPPPGEDPDGDPDPTTDAAFLGVEQNGTVSGTIEIRPNPGELPGVQKVAYYLNGSKSGKVYQAPFIWGGVNGDGTSGFNTTTIPDGAYTLSMAYTDGTGDHAVEINFTVNNGGTPPPPPPPGGDPDPDLGNSVLRGEVDFNQTGVPLVDVVHIDDDFGFAAGASSLYSIRFSNYSDPAVIATVGFSNPPIVDVEADEPTHAVFVLERNALWRIDMSNPASPQKQLMKDGLTGASDIIHSGDLVYIVHDGNPKVVACYQDGSGCFNTAVTSGADGLAHIAPDGYFFAVPGESRIRGVTNDGGTVFSQPTPAPIGTISGYGTLLYVSLRNGTMLVYETRNFNSGTSSLPVVKTFTLGGTDPVQSIAKSNAVVSVVDGSGIVEVFDVAGDPSPGLVDRITIPGAQSSDIHEYYLYVVTDTGFKIIELPFIAAGDRIAGISDGDTVSGVINVGPNLSRLPGISKVFYYLDRSQAGRVYQPPFLWGGPTGDGTTGFDTRNIPNGEHTLVMTFYDATGHYELYVRFNVQN